MTSHVLQLCPQLSREALLYNKEGIVRCGEVSPTLSALTLCCQPQFELIMKWLLNFHEPEG